MRQFEPLRQEGQVLGERDTRGYVYSRVANSIDPCLVGEVITPHMSATEGEVITPLHVQQPFLLECGKPLVNSLHPPVVGDTPLVENARFDTKFDRRDTVCGQTKFGSVPQQVMLKQGVSSVYTDVDKPPVMHAQLIQSSGLQSRYCGVAEGVSSEESSWNGSQIVNDVLSRFRSDCASVLTHQKSDDDFLSVTGSVQSMDISLTPSERLELDQLRQEVGEYRELVAGLSKLTIDPSQSGVSGMPQQQNVQSQFGGFGSFSLPADVEQQSTAGWLPSQQKPSMTNMQSQVSGWLPSQLQPISQHVMSQVSGWPPPQPKPYVDNVQQPISQVQHVASVQQGGLGVQQPVARVQPVQVQRGIGEGAGCGRGGIGVAPRVVELAKPGLFTGKKAEVDNFIFEMNQYCDSVGLSGGNAVRFVASHFKNDALTWWRSLAKDGVRIFDEIDLSDLLIALKKQFSDIDEEMKLRDRILGVRQQKSVTEYVTEFKSLQLKLGDARLTDDVALHVFLVGLKSFTRQQVMLQRPQNLEDAILLAERAEQSLYWNGRGQQRSFYQSRGVSRSDLPNRSSQYSDTRYKGPAPMVLGHVSKDTRAMATVKCYHCGRVGHYARDCHSKSVQSRGGSSGGQFRRGGFAGRGGQQHAQQKRGFSGPRHVNNVSYPPPPPVPQQPKSNAKN